MIIIMYNNYNMTGGVLQLVAKGIEDKYLTCDPLITFFKTVYRRHTNFTKEEINLYFTNKLDFGKEGYSRVENFGDLLHRLYLRIQLPKIDINYKSFTIGEIINLLEEFYDIKWTSVKNKNDKFTQSDADELFKIIEKEEKKLEKNIEMYYNIIYELEHIIDNYKSQDIIYTLIKYEEYELNYKIIDAHIKDVIESNKIIPLIFNNVNHDNKSNKSNVTDAYKIYEFLNYTCDKQEIINGLKNNIEILKTGIKNNDKYPFNKYIHNSGGNLDINEIRDCVGIDTACRMMELSKINDKDRYFYEEECKIEKIFKNKSKKNKSKYLTPQTTVSEIINKIKYVTDIFFDYDTNPYSEKERNKYELWEENKDINKYNKYNDLFSWLNIDNLSEYRLQIETLYNNFSSEIDVYRFMKSYIVQSSTYLQNLEAYDNSPQRILELYTDKLMKNTEILNRLRGSDNLVGLKIIINRSLNVTGYAKFAWIKKIGLYIIDNVFIKIDGQLIDKQYGEWLNIWHELTKDINKEEGYNRLIGNVKELTTYNSRQKEEYELLIPLHFWFCRHIGSSLPLIALHNTDIRVYVKLKPFDDICYYEKYTTFRKRPKLNCSLIGEYIYVEEKERKKISMSKLEYLIDTVQYNGEMQINRNNVHENIINAITRFNNPCKEIFWLLQDMNHIKNKEWDRYDFYGENPVKKAKITFNIRDREKFKDGVYYNYIQPYERHYSSPDKGINVYNFGLDPESVVTTGTANMNQIEEMGIHVILLDKILKKFNKGKNLVFRWPIYALTNNILRIFSGMSGLLWQE